MKRNMSDWKNSILQSKEKKAMPIMTYPGLNLTGKSVMEMVTNGEIQFQCIQALSARYPSIASATMIMDLSVEAEAFGSRIIFSTHEIPTVSKQLINSFSEIDHLVIPATGQGRTGENLKAASLAVQQITDRPVFGGIIGPFSLAGRLIDISEMMTGILIDPDGARSLLDICTSFLKNYARHFKDIGADGIVIAEPAAGLLAPEECHEFSSGYVKMIVDYVQDENFMVILHNCGNTLSLVNSMLTTGSAGFHFGNAVDLAEILPQIPPDRLVFGNLDPSGVIKNSNPETIYTKTICLLKKTSPYNNHVLSSGCDIPPGTPLDNLDSMFNALDHYNKLLT